MTEPDVTLTDYGLTLLCSWFVWALGRQVTQRHQLPKLWMAFFGSIAVASLTGGTVHGFFLDESTLGYRILWPATLLAIGVTAVCAWGLAGSLFSTTRTSARKWGMFAGSVFFGYSAVVIFYSQQFIVAMVNYLPAMVVLLIAGIYKAIQKPSTALLLLIAGILISFAAAYIQQAHIGFHPSYFNHNATYHLIQAVGLLILFKSARGLIQSEGTIH